MKQLKSFDDLIDQTVKNVHQKPSGNTVIFLEGFYLVIGKDGKVRIEDCDYNGLTKNEY